MSNTNDFSKAKVGDKLWSIQLGECVVCEINHAYPRRLFPVLCKNSIRTAEKYTNLGLHGITDTFQSLFWSKPEIIAPEMPKRKKKVIRFQAVSIDARVSHTDWKDTIEEVVTAMKRPTLPLPYNIISYEFEVDDE